MESGPYLLCTIFWNSTRMRNPLHTACVRVISLARRSSRISSSVPSKPALKNTCRGRGRGAWRCQAALPRGRVPRGRQGQRLLSQWMHYLGVSKFVLSVININGRQKLFTGLLAVNELSLWDGTGIQHAVSAMVDAETITDSWIETLTFGREGPNR